MDGTGTFVWPSGRKYIGKWMKGKMHGKGKLEYEDGN